MMNRLRFVQTTAAGVAAAGIATSIRPASVLAEETAEAGLGMTIAQKIGGSLVDNSLGYFEQLGLGSMMSFLGVGDSSDEELSEIINTLSEIQEELHTLQHSVDDLRTDMDKELALVDYDVLIGPVQGLIDANKQLTTDFVVLLGAQRGQVNSVKKDIRTLMDADFLKGLNTWNSWLTGSSGQTSLLAAWSQAVCRNSGNFFNWGAAERIQKQWEFFDAQQALTVAYLVEHYNTNGDTDMVTSTLAAWQANRTAQLALLRGTTSQLDRFPVVGADGKRSAVETPLANALPPDTMVSIKTSLMWYLYVSPRVQMGPSGATDLARYYWPAMTPWCNKAANATGKTGWNAPSSDEFTQLAKECGGSAGGDTDSFRSQMIQQGLRISPLGIHIWTSTRVNYTVVTGRHCGGGGKFGWESCYNTTTPADGFTYYSEFGSPQTAQGGDGAMVMLCRQLSDGEAYWYDTSNS